MKNNVSKTKAHTIKTKEVSWGYGNSGTGKVVRNTNIPEPSIVKVKSKIGKSETPKDPKINIKSSLTEKDKSMYLPYERK